MGKWKAKFFDQQTSNFNKPFSPININKFGKDPLYGT